MISSFPIHHAYNPGGYNTFYFVPVNLVSSFPMISNGAAVVPVGLFGNNQWLQGYATRETLSFEEEPQDNGNGPFYLQTVTGFVPGERAELIDLMEKMPFNRFMIIIKDSFGKYRLVGTPMMPLTFSSKYSSGTLKADQKGFTFKFTVESIRRAPVYNP